MPEHRTIFMIFLLCAAVFASSALVSARLYRNALHRATVQTAGVENCQEKVRIYHEITGETVQIRKTLDRLAFWFALLATALFILLEIRLKTELQVFSEPLRTVLFIVSFGVFFALFNGPRTWANVRIDHQVVGLWAGGAALVFPCVSLLVRAKYKSCFRQMLWAYPILIGITLFESPLLYEVFRSHFPNSVISLIALTTLYTTGIILALRLFRPHSYTLSFFMIAFLASGLTDILHANSFHADLRGLGGWIV